MSAPRIGVFDSGVGGLTVLKELLSLLPDAHYFYFGDTARLPYGSKSVETVGKYAVSSAKFLESHGIDLMVIACNTATALAFEPIQNSLSVPVVGVVEPGAQRATESTRNRRAVVIGTEATISSHAYQRALAARGLTVREKACPLLVPLVEEGWTEHSVTEQVARIYLDEAFADGFRQADVLLLGCTHYPLLRPLLGRVAPKEVTIVDSAESTAHAVAEKLGANKSTPETRNSKLQFVETGNSKLQFFATDSVEKFRRLGERFLGRRIADVTHVDIEV
jgi:glutamate racemase